MLTRNRVLTVVIYAVVAGLFLVRCGISTPQVIREQVVTTVVVEREVPVEREIIKEVPVEKVVFKEVPVEKVVVKEIPIERIVTPTPATLGILKIGINAEYPPFEMVDQVGEIIGFDPDLLDAISKAAGFQYELVNTAWDGIFVALASGEFDAVMSATTITEERARTVDFSKPYLNAGQMITIRSDEAEITKPEDLSGKKVSVQLGTTGDIWLTEQTKAEITRYDEITLAFQALAIGDVDAAVADGPTALEIVKANPEMKLRVLPGVYTDELYGIAVAKERPEVLAAINAGLAAVQALGKYDEIYDKWFGLPDVPEEVESLVIGTTSRVTDLDPGKAFDFHTWEIFYNVAGGLLTYVPGTTDLTPLLAEDFPTVSDDGLEWTFKLRQGMEFPDGSALDAYAVKWSLDRVVRLKGDPSWLVSTFLKEAVVVDDMTIKFQLRHPVGFFPYLTATTPWFPISPNCYSEDTLDPDSTCSGVGPYMIKRWERGTELEMVGNPDYPGNPPRWPSITLRYFADLTSVRLALENGKIDVAWKTKTILPTDYVELYEDLRDNASLKITEGPGAYIRIICFNSTIPPFDDPKIRQAISLAIDREYISERVFFNTHEPLYSMLPFGVNGHTAAFPERDLGAAEVLLKEAGYNTVNPLIMDLWIAPSHYGDTETEVAAAIKTALEETGMISVTLQSTGWITYTEYLRAGTMPVFLLSWFPDILDPDDYTWSFAHSGIARELGLFYTNETMDELLEAARIETNMDNRLVLYEQIQQLWTTECPTIPLTQGLQYVATRMNVTGVKLSPYMLLPYFLLEK